MLSAANVMEGIVRCDMIAESIVAAAKATGGFKVPVVVRLQGTNCDKGLKLVLDLGSSFKLLARRTDRLQIENSGLDNIFVDADFETAARCVVELTNDGQKM